MLKKHTIIFTVYIICFIFVLFGCDSIKDLDIDEYIDAFGKLKDSSYFDDDKEINIDNNNDDENNNDNTDNNNQSENIQSNNNDESQNNSNNNDIVNDNTEQNSSSENENVKDNTESNNEQTLSILPYDLNELSIVDKAIPENFNNFSYDYIVNGSIQNSFERDYDILFPLPEFFTDVEGVTCFRGNNLRDNPAFGFANIRTEELEKVWEYDIGSIDLWTGVGWTGQASIIKWDDDIKNIMNIYPEKKSKDGLIEVIISTLDGNIYFLDLEDGEPTRDKIEIGFSHKGSVSLDPRGIPLLYAGQGIDKNGSVYSDIKFRIFSLIDQTEIFSINGTQDENAYRNWGAFDSNPLIDRYTDSLIQCGENGIVYTGKLNTEFDLENSTISVNPELVKYRYKSPFYTEYFPSNQGIENSPAIYKNLMYFSDNGGFLQCVDLKTMKTVWAANVTDDTDSSCVLEVIDDNNVFLYTGCEVDMRNENTKAYMRKFNALTGELIWETEVDCYYFNGVNGGILATPVIGKNNVSDMVYFNVARTGRTSFNGRLCALNKETGEIIWKNELDIFCWSSPVAVYNQYENGYLVYCDAQGYVHLLDAKTGRTLDKIRYTDNDGTGNIESSPVVYKNMVVVGTRQNKIVGFRIK